MKINESWIYVQYAMHTPANVHKNGVDILSKLTICSGCCDLEQMRIKNEQS